MIACDERRRGRRGYSRAAASIAAAAALAVALFGTAPARALEPAIIPIPAAVVPAAGAFEFTGPLRVIVPPHDRAAGRAAHDLAELLAFPAGLPLVVRSTTGASGALVLVRAPSVALGTEGYRLTVTPRRITIAARDEAGWFYGGITLWQLLHASAGRTAVDGQVIDDRPELAWRGLMLDSARHFQSPAFVARLLDWMALHKLNVLHWHLTDDQGWRIEIRKYPALTAVGAFRVPAGPAAAADIDPQTGVARRYGGYYSQRDIRALVAHAAHRHITIVPEIDLPGHASAAIASDPALGVRPGLVPDVPSDWGIYSHVLAPDEATFRFLEDVFSEVLALFPGRYVHIGGDEVVPDEWLQSPHLAARLRQLGLHSPAELRHYFARRIEQFLRARGRRAVGWDEILEPGLSRTAVVMSWRGVAGAVAAARQGNDTVLAPDPALYFDHRQGTAAGEPPGRAAVVSLEDVYRFDPTPAALGAARRHLLGVQANLWTEHVRTDERVAVMAFPRLAALAEVAWSAPGRRDWPGFERRIAAALARYRAIGLPFDESLFAVTATTTYADDRRTATLALARQADFGEIRYSVDGTDPGPASPLYREPLPVTLPAEVRAASFAGAERLSTPRVFQASAALAGHRDSHELRLCTSAVALSLEDDAPLTGPRAVFLLDIENPCWIYPDADLGRAVTIAAAVGQVPFNFQIGADRARMQFARPVTQYGELEVRVDGCSGELYARLPLEPAVASNAVTVLPGQPVAAREGRHDLCLRFAQAGVDPLWALDWVELRAAPASAGTGRP
jgi:hexosaminidase